MRKLITAATVGLAVTAAAIGAMSAPPSEGQAKPECHEQHTQACALDRIKALAGTWESKDETGATVVASVFEITAAGSAVKETMFPGTPHEMVNMYHMDGEALVVTHYCAGGNQPTMKAHHIEAGSPIEFTFDRVCNLSAPDAAYMGGLKLTMTDENHLTQDWTHFDKGQKAGAVKFELVRKKS